MEPLVFKETKFMELVKGEKYIIKRFNKTYYNGIFTGHAFKFGSNISMFEEVKDVSKPTEIYIWKLEFYDDSARTFHKMIRQKEQRQNAMELRAVNLLLQRIVGDNAFKYL